MVPASRLSGEQLRDLAECSFDVLNWAKRLGFNKEQQIAELVRTFEVRLGYRQPEPPRSELADVAKTIGKVSSESGSNYDGVTRDVPGVSRAAFHVQCN